MTRTRLAADGLAARAHPRVGICPAVLVRALRRGRQARPGRGISAGGDQTTAGEEGRARRRDATCCATAACATTTSPITTWASSISPPGGRKEALDAFDLARKAKINPRDDEFKLIGAFEQQAKTALATAANNPPAKGGVTPPPPPQRAESLRSTAASSSRNSTSCSTPPAVSSRRRISTAPSNRRITRGRSRTSRGWAQDSGRTPC